MSKPDLFPKASAAGITLDPRTLERVIPESRRPDGTVRKQLKIRPGFTPQEDVRRFRGTKQAQMDATVLPKGHIIGWVPPTASSTSSSAAKSKSAKKNEKRKEKRKEKVSEEVAAKIKDSWEDEDEEDTGKVTELKEAESKGVHTAEQPNWAAAPGPKEKKGPKEEDEGAALAEKLEKLDVR
ncbi:unnamed protein product [Somion occarium]|uniref:WIBG Mago-binding domain-containing protein n=1 Tax=Somion occarium TaxID=3059160 RepID=A0ABP1D2U2_9APHY